MPLRLGLVRYERPAGGDKFVVPQWAAAPHSGVALHVTKNGGTLSTLALDGGAKYYMFGRAPTVCVAGHGYVINHPTLSRQHAVVVHGADDASYLMDLDSPHGTCVNGERLDPYMPRLLENGNILCFGQSTRKYVVRLFPREEQLLRAGDRVSLSYSRLAGLRVSSACAEGDAGDSGAGSRAGASDEEEEEDDDDSLNGDAEASPGTLIERQRRRHSLKQARLFSGLNARVSYPSPKTLLRGSLVGGSKDVELTEAAVAAAAAALAATASPTASPQSRPVPGLPTPAQGRASTGNSPALLALPSARPRATGSPHPLSASFSANAAALAAAAHAASSSATTASALARAAAAVAVSQAQAAAAPMPLDLLPAALYSAPPMCALPGPAMVSAPARSRSVSLMDTSGAHGEGGEEGEGAPLEPEHALNLRLRSNSTCEIRKRPAASQMNPKGCVRRRSTFERRVSFCAAPEIIIESALAAGSARSTPSPRGDGADSVGGGSSNGGPGSPAPALPPSPALRSLRHATSEPSPMAVGFRGFAGEPGRGARCCEENSACCCGAGRAAVAARCAGPFQPSPSACARPPPTSCLKKSRSDEMRRSGSGDGDSFLPRSASSTSISSASTASSGEGDLGLGMELDGFGTGGAGSRASTLGSSLGLSLAGSFLGSGGGGSSRSSSDPSPLASSVLDMCHSIPPLALEAACVVGALFSAGTVPLRDGTGGALPQRSPASSLDLIMEEHAPPGD
jgi:hypothetical protein